MTDGPFLWRGENGALLCLWSGFSGKGYAQGLAVSDNGEIDGHFTQLDPLFLEDGGHGMLFRTLEGETCLALHRLPLPLRINRRKCRQAFRILQKKRRDSE